MLRKHPSVYVQTDYVLPRLIVRIGILVRSLVDWFDWFDCSLLVLNFYA